METIYKVNQNRNKSALQIAEILNDCELLFKFDVEFQGNKYMLHVATNKASVEYVEIQQRGMITFLEKLKEHVSNKDDIEDLIEELAYLQLQ